MIIQGYRQNETDMTVNCKETDELRHNRVTEQANNGTNTGQTQHGSDGQRHYQLNRQTTTTVRLLGHSSSNNDVSIEKCKQDVNSGTREREGAP